MTCEIALVIAGITQQKFFSLETAQAMYIKIGK